MRRTIAVLFALTWLALASVAVSAAGDLEAATAWIASQVGEDGGLSDGFSEGSNLGATLDAALAAVAAGADMTAWGADASPLDYVATRLDDSATTGIVAKSVLVALGSGLDPRDYAGHDLIAQLEGGYDAGTGLYTGTVTDHALAMVALGAAGETIPEGAVDALLGLQADDGGWAFDGVSQSDTNTTGIALQALAAAGQGDGDAVSAALDFLRGQQNDDSGFPYQIPGAFGTDSDANSTAWVIQGLLAVGESLDDWGNPELFLASLQQADGSFQWQTAVEGANFLATAQAVPALAEVSYLDLPVVTVARAPEVMAAESMDEAEAEGEGTSPELLPTTGRTNRAWLWAILTGVVVLLGGFVLRRVAR